MAPLHRGSRLCRLRYVARDNASGGAGTAICLLGPQGGVLLSLGRLRYELSEAAKDRERQADRCQGETSRWKRRSLALLPEHE